MTTRYPRIGQVALVLALGASCATSQDHAWPDYRGPRRDGHSDAVGLPVEWSESRNIAWKTEIHGRAWSSPVVADDEVWLTSATADGKELFVLCVDVASGEVGFDEKLFEVDEPQYCHPFNSYASPSPVIDGGQVYVTFGAPGTACLDRASKEPVWRRTDLVCNHFRGAGSSPLAYEDLLILTMDGSDDQYVIALDKATGETRWKTPRSPGLAALPRDFRKAYSTPIVVDVDGAPRLISSGAEATVGYDPETGEASWEVRHSGFSMAARPLAGGGLVFLNTGFTRPRLLAVRAYGEGDVTDTDVVWTCRRAVPKMSSALLVDGSIYMVNDGGIATCLDASTGKRRWYKRIGGEHCASPVFAGGRIYFFDRDGRTVVIAPGDKFEKLAINELDEGFMASPAVLGDAFILRTATHLYRIGEARAR